MHNIPKLGLIEVVVALVVLKLNNSVLNVPLKDLFITPGVCKSPYITAKQEFGEPAIW
jgi:hypothetical protein